MKNFYSLILFFFSIYISSDYIQYSGLSYASMNNQISDAYPNTLKLESSLRKTLYKHLKDNNSMNPDLRLDESNTFKDGSFSIILALENEYINTRIEPYISTCYTEFNLGMQVIVFSAQDQQILSIQNNTARRRYLDPLVNGACQNRNKKIDLLRFAEIFYNLPNIPESEYKNYILLKDAEIIDLIKSNSIISNAYYADQSILGNSINQILSTKIDILNNTNFFVGIDDVNLGQLALDQMSGDKEFSKNTFFTDSSGSFQQQSYKAWAGQQFSKWFSDTFNYPLIPYVKGRALG